MKQLMNVWTVKERDWAKDNEILKTSHSHNIEWMQQLQRDLIDVKDLVHQFKQDHTLQVQTISEECQSLRTQWEAHADCLNGKLTEYDQKNKKQHQEIELQAQQRLDDLELMEQALHTIQKQHLQLRTTVEQNVNQLQQDVKQSKHSDNSMHIKSQQTETSLEQLQTKILQIERDQKRKFDYLTKIITVN